MSVWRRIIFTILLAVLSSGAFALDTGDLLVADKPVGDWPPLILARPVMQHVHETVHFCIHYNTTGDSAVYHPGEDINPYDSVPDYVNRIGEYFEAAHNVYIFELEYDMPPPDGLTDIESKYDVYVTTTSGLTTPEYLSDYYFGREAYVSYIQVGNNMFTDHNPTDPYPHLKGVCAHEYFHAVQMAYRGHLVDQKPWFYELTAMWAEERVFDDLNELYYNLDDYYSDIDKSIYLHGGFHMYGAWVLAEYLSQNYGNDIIKHVFEKHITNPSSIGSLASALNSKGLDINREFTILTGWNFFTGPNYHNQFFEEGMSFPATVPVVNSYSSYPTGWQENGDAIENLGVNYIYFDNPGISKGDLVVTVKADEQYHEMICLAGIYDGSRPISLGIHKAMAGETIQVRVQNFNEYTGAIMAINWSYQDSVIHDLADYSYSAFVESLSVDIVDGVEPVIPESFSLNGNYPNPFNLSTKITFYWNFNPSYYTIAIYDITGRQVETVTGTALTGENKVNWRASDDLSSGVYYYNLTAGERSKVGRMLLLK